MSVCVRAGGRAGRVVLHVCVVCVSALTCLCGRERSRWVEKGVGFDHLVTFFSRSEAMVPPKLSGPQDLRKALSAKSRSRLDTGGGQGLGAAAGHSRWGRGAAGPHTGECLIYGLMPWKQCDSGGGGDYYAVGADHYGVSGR